MRLFKWLEMRPILRQLKLELRGQLPLLSSPKSSHSRSLTKQHLLLRKDSNQRALYFCTKFKSRSCHSKCRWRGALGYRGHVSRVVEAWTNRGTTPTSIKRHRPAKIWQSCRRPTAPWRRAPAGGCSREWTGRCRSGCSGWWAVRKGSPVRVPADRTHRRESRGPVTTRPRRRRGWPWRRSKTTRRGV